MGWRMSFGTFASGDAMLHHFRMLERNRPEALKRIDELVVEAKIINHPLFRRVVKKIRQARDAGEFYIYSGDWWFGVYAESEVHILRCCLKPLKVIHCDQNWTTGYGHIAVEW
ncbi:hypothetical protein HY971_02870 [Candidatus Kaiserbacteria bacterium]|nr:hypothetical protein [Candidatus Kaiserbacteria bacterium]